jgi:recombination DNA repair RAD52 pathway protein
MNSLYQQLSEPFPQEMEKTVTKSGTNLVYIPVSEIINRLNKVLGVDGWSFEVIKCERDATDSDFVVAHVRITAMMVQNIEGRPPVVTITRDGIGGQKIKRNKQQNAIIDLGDEFKGAISDALKKAAQTLGVGLYLARSEDAIEIEQVIDANIQAQAQKETGSPKYFQVKELFESLDSSKKNDVKKFWSDYSGGTSKPLSKMSDDELDVILSEIIRLQFDGAVVVEQPTNGVEMPARRDLD